MQPPLGRLLEAVSKHGGSSWDKVITDSKLKLRDFTSKELEEAWADVLLKLKTQPTTDINCTVRFEDSFKVLAKPQELIYTAGGSAHSSQNNKAAEGRSGLSENMANCQSPAQSEPLSCSSEEQYVRTALENAPINDMSNVYQHDNSLTSKLRETTLYYTRSKPKLNHYDCGGNSSDDDFVSQSKRHKGEFYSNPPITKKPLANSRKRTYKVSLGRYNTCEVDQIVMGVQKHGEKNWEKILEEGKEVFKEGRTAYGLYMKWQSMRLEKQVISQGTEEKGNCQPKLWSNEEVTVLLESITCIEPDILTFQRLLEKHYDIFHPSRNAASLHKKWYSLKNQQIISISESRGPHAKAWTAQEIKVLNQSVQKYGENNWHKIFLENLSIFSHRSPGALRNKWYTLQSPDLPRHENQPVSTTVWTKEVFTALLLGAHQFGIDSIGQWIHRRPQLSNISPSSLSIKFAELADLYKTKNPLAILNKLLSTFSESKTFLSDSKLQNKPLDLINAGVHHQYSNKSCKADSSIPESPTDDHYSWKKAKSLAATNTVKFKHPPRFTTIPVVDESAKEFELEYTNPPLGDKMANTLDCGLSVNSIQTANNICQEVNPNSLRSIHDHNFIQSLGDEEAFQSSPDYQRIIDQIEDTSQTIEIDHAIIERDISIGSVKPSSPLHELSEKNPSGSSLSHHSAEAQSLVAPCNKVNDANNSKDHLNTRVILDGAFDSPNIHNINVHTNNSLTPASQHLLNHRPGFSRAMNHCASLPILLSKPVSDESQSSLPNPSSLPFFVNTDDILDEYSCNPVELVNLSLPASSRNTRQIASLSQHEDDYMYDPPTLNSSGFMSSAHLYASSTDKAFEDDALSEDDICLNF